MTDPTSSSTNLSQSAEDVPLNENLQPSKNVDMSLLDIPVFNKKTSEPVSNPKTLDLSPSEPSLCEEQPNEELNPKFEYEFSLVHGGTICFVHLYDTCDLSACERILHRPVEAKEITHSPTTGNAFVMDGPFKYTFTKEPYKRTWTTHADIKAGVEYENTVAKTQRKHKMNAEDILGSL